MTRVFLDYDLEQLDRAYDQQVWAPKRDQVIKRNALASAGARVRIGSPLTVAYGPTAVETLDIYRTEQPNTPVLILLCAVGSWGGRRPSLRGYVTGTEATTGVTAAGGR